MAEDIATATEDAREVLKELHYLMTPGGAGSADAAVIKWFVENTVTWDQDDRDGASVVRMANAGCRRSEEILREQATLLFQRHGQLPYLLEREVPRLLTGERAEWPSRDPAITHWRGLCIAAAVWRVTLHGFHPTRGRDKHDSADAKPSACSIVAGLVGRAERTIEDAWAAHRRQPEPLEAARAVLALTGHTVT